MLREGQAPPLQTCDDDDKKCNKAQPQLFVIRSVMAMNCGG